MASAGPVNKILVPVDFSQSSRAALGYAVALAEVLSARIEVLHAYDVPAVGGGGLVLTARGVSRPFAEWREQRAAKELADLAGAVSTNVPITTALAEGSPAPTIVEHARKHSVDLIVIATRGRSQVARVLLGSVADRVVRTAPCPVLTVRDGQGADGP